MQLVLGRDAVPNTKFEAEWKHIRDGKQKLIEQNYKRENAKRTHTKLLCMAFAATVLQ
jgi:hypothetical protein